jgi:histidinol-phosphatase (PHP family)
MIDLHVHTSLCGHAEGSLEEYVSAARSAGVTTMAFCDHLPLPPGWPTHYTMAWTDLPAYVEQVTEVAARCRADGGPEVLLGIEADRIPGADHLVLGALEEHPFDVVLGSVHFIEEWAFDDPDLVARYGEWVPDELWDRYFAELAATAATKMFDVIAHPDLVKKFGCAPVSDLRPWYEEIAAVFAGCGVAVEVNTGGLRKPCREIYPSLGLLNACRRHGVPATIGSDAHMPSHVGAAQGEARALLEAAGYRSVVVFRKRVAEEVPL